MGSSDTFDGMEIPALMSLKMGNSRLRNEAPAESSQKKKAEPLKEEEEELLWKKSFLGSGSPQTLVDTMVVINGIYFALRSGGEHHQLRSDPCQI